jgi:competence protein ComEA
VPPDSDAILARLHRVMGSAATGTSAAGSFPEADEEGLRRRPSHAAEAYRGRTIAVLVVCVVALLLAGVLFWRSRPTSIAVPAADALGSPVVATATPGPSVLVPVTPAAIVVVQVVGRVRRPGVVRLAAGSRVVDAIAAAWGLAPHTDPASVNLARLVVDGEQIDVGSSVVAAGPSSGGAGSGAAAGGASGGAPAGPLDLNTATVEQLDALPGVGPVLAQRIVDQRTRNGRFTSVDDLRQVSGIGDKKFADLASLVRV